MSHLRNWVIGLCVMSFWMVGSALADESDVARGIEKAVAAVKPGTMRIAIHVMALQSARTVYEHNADDALRPASNMKLLTLAAALDSLNPAFKYRTTLAMRGDDLIVLGRGDPSLGDPKLAAAAKEPITAIFHDWAARLKDKGITEVKGDLIIDDTVFEAERYNPNWPPDQHQNWYSAPVDGLNFNDNCVEFTVSPGKPGEPAVTGVIPPNTYVTIRNECKTGAKQNPVVSRRGEEPIYVISGTCKEPGTLGVITVPDPGMLFASACRTALAAKGIKIDGKIRRERVRDDRGNLPPTCTTIAIYERDLRDMLGRIGKDSQNLFAECLFKTIAFESSAVATGVGDGSYAAGRKYVQGFLDKCGAPKSPDLVIDDGSGYSPRNRVTPRIFTHILRYMARHPRRMDFRSALAEVGEEGTLKKRMKDLKGRIQAKTGYLSGTYALSGYARTDSTKEYCFSILVNQVTVGGAEVKNLEDSICRVLVADGEVRQGKPTSAKAKK